MQNTINKLPFANAESICSECGELQYVFILIGRVPNSTKCSQMVLKESNPHDTTLLLFYLGFSFYLFFFLIFLNPMSVT